MKMLIVMGSPRENGNTNSLCKEFLSILDKNKVDYDFLPIGTSDELHPCQCCSFCSDNNYCMIRDDMFEVIKNFADYDVLIIFTPIYFFQMSGQTKVCLDRLGGSGDWKDKILYLVTCSGSSGRMGGNDILTDVMERIAEYHGCHYLGYINKVTNDYILECSEEDKRLLNEMYYDIIEYWKEL